MPKAGKKKRTVWTEFDCPICSAHNIVSDGFSATDDVNCMYCGSVFVVKEIDEERYKLVEN